MNLDELRTVQSKERRKDSLQQLRDSFYRDVATYIQDLKATRDRRADQVDDPFSDNEVRRLSDELETAEEVAEAVYERRVGKVVKLASFAAADMPVDDEGMTGEERELFDDLVARITQNKQAVLDVLSGAVEATESTNRPVKESGPQSPVEAAKGDAAANGQTASNPTPPEPTADSDNVLAEAMGAESGESPGAPAADATAEPTQPATDSEVDREQSEPAAPSEIPPPEAEPEPDAVLGTSTDGGTAEVAATATGDTTHPEPTPSAATPDAKPPSENADSVESAADDSDRTTVRITKNVGDIFCADGREYTLCSEDVVTLPTANAEPLVEKDAAQQLD